MHSMHCIYPKHWLIQITLLHADAFLSRTQLGWMGTRPSVVLKGDPNRNLTLSSSGEYETSAFP